MQQYVGLDIHSKETVFEIQNQRGNVLETGRFPTTAEGFERLASKVEPNTPVGLETGNMAFFVARQLMRQKLSPVVIDAHEVRIKAQRPNQKSDRRDAHEICEGLRRDIYRTIVHVPPESIQQLRRLISRRRHFIRSRTQEINATKQLLKSQGFNAMTRRKLTTEKAWQKLFDDLAGEEEVLELVQMHFAMWQSAQAMVVKLEAKLEAQSAPFKKYLELLQGIPGVGPVTSLTIVASLSDVQRFPNAKSVASYSGLVPSTFQTGGRDTHGRITKRGAPELRAMLCEAAHHASRSSNPFNPYFASLSARKGYKVAVTAVAHRILRISWAMLRDEKPFVLERLGVVEGPFEEKKVRHYKLDPRRRA